MQLRIRAFGASAGIEQVGVQSPFIDHSGHFGERALRLRPSDRATAKAENREVKGEADDDVGSGQGRVELVHAELGDEHRRAKPPLVLNVEVGRVRLSAVASQRRVIGQALFEALDSERDIRWEPWRAGGGELCAGVGTNPGRKSGRGCRHESARRLGFSRRARAIAPGTDHVEARSRAGVEFLARDLEKAFGILGGEFEHAGSLLGLPKIDPGDACGPP